MCIMQDPHFKSRKPKASHRKSYHFYVFAFAILKVNVFCKEDFDYIRKLFYTKPIYLFIVLCCCKKEN